MVERDVRAVRELVLGPKARLLSSVMSSSHRVSTQLNKSCARRRTFREQDAISTSHRLNTEYQQLTEHTARRIETDCRYQTKDQ
jgi:hypothetical protein